MGAAKVRIVARLSYFVTSLVTRQQLSGVHHIGNEEILVAIDISRDPFCKSMSVMNAKFCSVKALYHDEAPECPSLFGEIDMMVSNIVGLFGLHLCISCLDCCVLCMKDHAS